MKEHENIDELFKDAASGFNPQPSDEVWAGIEGGLFNTVQSKRMFYVKWALVAVLLLIGISAFWYFSTGNKQQIVDVEGADMNIESHQMKTEKETFVLKTDEAKVDTEQESEIENNYTFNKPLTAQNENNNEDIVDEDLLPTAKHNDETETLWANTFGVENIEPRSIYEIAFLNAEPIEKQITIEEYLEKRKKLHTYTGLGIKPAMVYYPNTQDQFTYTAEVNYGVVFNKFYIELGVGYQQMNERGVYKFNYKSNDSIGFYNKVVSFEINPQNPDNITYKTSKTTVYDSINHYSLQSPLFKYSYLNVPLKFGYRVWENNRLTLGLETGLIFSKLLSSEIPEASFSAPEYTLVSIEDNTPIRVNMNMRVLVAIRLNYRFAKAVSLSLQPEFTKYLNSIYDTDIGDPNIKPYTMGLRFGVYYNF